MNENNYDLISFIEEKRSKYLSQIREKMEQCDDIVIYGAGIYGRDLCKFLRRNSIEPSAFCVTDTEYNPPKVENLSVNTVNNYANVKQQPLFLIAATEPIEGAMIHSLQSVGQYNYLSMPGCIESITDESFMRPVLEITPRAGCAVHCRYCPQDDFLKLYFSYTNKHELTFNDFKTCLDKTPSDLIIDFSGFVEPFLNKNTIDMILYANEKKRNIRLYTTFVGLDLENLRKIEHIPFCRVVVHLPDIYKYANIPLTDEYFEVLHHAVTLSKPNGIPFIDSANSQSKPHPDVMKIIGNKVSVSWNLIDRAGNLQDNVLNSNQHGSCAIYCTRAANINHNVLLPNGDVVICCMDYKMQHKLGNLLKDTYEDIVNGQAKEAVRRQMVCGGNILCRHCTAARGFV